MLWSTQTLPPPFQQPGGEILVVGEEFRHQHIGLQGVLIDLVLHVRRHPGDVNNLDAQPVEAVALGRGMGLADADEGCTRGAVGEQAGDDAGEQAGAHGFASSTDGNRRYGS